MSMTAMERFRARIEGRPVDRVPNVDIIMTFGAHYIGKPLAEYYLDHRVLVQANLAMLEHFGLDIVQAISDPYREAADLGLSVDFPTDGLPVARRPLFESLEASSRLRLLRPEEGRRMTDRLEAIRMLRESVGGEVPIMGWVEGALAEAADLCGVDTLMMGLMTDPERVDDLLTRLTDLEVSFAEAQIEAGADLIGLGDAVASQISPDTYRRFALPCEQRIFSAVRAKGAIPRLHICGDTSRILKDMAQCGADIVDLDWMVSLPEAVSVFGSDGPAPCGHFDPVSVMLQGSPGSVREAVIRDLEEGGPRLFSMAGCEIPDGSPRENLLAHGTTLSELGNSPPR